jgi:hypothetical protein
MTVISNVLHYSYELPVGLRAVGKLSCLICIRSIIRLTFRTQLHFSRCCFDRQQQSWLLFYIFPFVFQLGVHYGTYKYRQLFILWDNAFYSSAAEDSVFWDVTPKLISSAFVTFLSYNDKLNQLIIVIAATL